LPIIYKESGWDKMKLFSTIIKHPNAVWLILFMVLLTHLPFMNEPPRSIHVWRQSITVAMSRNLYEEGMNPLKPKVDCRYDTDGITGSHFLAYEFSLACLYQVFGFHEFIHRWWSLSLYMLLLVGFYSLILGLTANLSFAFAGSWMLAFSPELFYYGINALPDILALTAGVWSLVFFMHWHHSPKTIKLLLFFAFITVSGLTKLQYICFGVPVATFCIIQVVAKKYSLSLLLKLIVLGILSVTICTSWYVYATYLVNKSGLRVIGIILYLEDSWRHGIHVIKQNLLSDLPELLLGFSSFILFVLGSYHFIKSKPKHPWLIPFISMLVVLLFYYGAALRQMAIHQYYLLPFFPLLFLVATYGFSFVHKRNAMIAMVLLTLAPLLACIRIIPARWSKGKEGILQTFYQPEKRQQLTQLIPPNARIITGPDLSNCINFYFTHTKGFGYRLPGELFKSVWGGELMIDNYVGRGATYILITDKNELNQPQLNRYIDTVVFENEEVWLAKLRE